MKRETERRQPEAEPQRDTAHRPERFPESKEPAKRADPPFERQPAPAGSRNGGDAGAPGTGPGRRS